MVPDALRAALSDPGAVPNTLAVLSEDDPLRKTLRPLGYQVSRWLKAMAALQARVHKQRLPEPLLTFLDPWLPREQPTADSPSGRFHLALSRCNGSIRMQAGPVAAIANPRWWALLRLPALRDFWIAELRASHHAHLLHIVPQAWLLDPAPLPPGAVIAGLELADWRHLPHRRSPGDDFQLQRPGFETVHLSAEVAPPAWLAHLETALTARDAVLVRDETAEAWLIARYQLTDGEITLADAFGANPR